MAPLKVLSAVGALLAMGSAALPSASDPQISYSADLGESGQCLTEIDAARNAAGLAKFVQPESNTQEKQLPAQGTTAAWDPFCKYLFDPTQQKSALPDGTNENFKEGTYAFAALDSATPDCSAIVGQWKRAYKNFNGLPPKKSDAAQLYKNTANVSFVAIFNPSTGATAECRVVTCTETTSKTASSPSPTENDQKRNAFALICMTTPDALKDGKAPFTQEQWEKISTASRGSAVTALPGLAVVTMVALSIALL